MTQDIILRGMTWSDPRGYDPLVAASDAFQARHPNVSIVWDKRSLQGFESTPVEELAALYDLMIIDHPHLGAIIDTGCVLPIDSLGPVEVLETLRAQSVGKSYDSYAGGGHQWALPVDAAAQVQAIRPDLISTPLRRWAEVINASEHVVWPLRPPHSLMSFFTLMANIGAPMPVRAGQKIDGAAARHVISAMQQLAQRIDPACLAMDPIAALDALATSNRFAVAPLAYLYAPYARAGYRPHRIAYHDIPALGEAGPIGSALGGTGIAISARTAQPELCTEFALWVAGAEIQRGLYSANNGQPGNAEAWSAPEVNAAVGNAYIQTRQTHDHAYLRPRHNGYMAYQEEASHILQEALTGAIAIEQALEALQTRFDESFQS